MGEEVVLEALQQKGSATGLTGEVRVVEECTHALAGQEVGLHGSQGGRDPEGKKGRHERVPLLAALGLKYAVGVVGSVRPHKLRRRTVKESHKWQDGIGIGCFAERCEHGLPAN